MAGAGAGARKYSLPTSLPRYGSQRQPAPIPRFTGTQEETSMKSKVHILMASFAVAFVALMGTMGSARAADEWFVLSEQTLNATDPSATIKSAGGRWEKDVKQVKLSVEGADVEITNLVLNWDNRPDDTVKDVGVVKSGGQ